MKVNHRRRMKMKITTIKLIMIVALVSAIPAMAQENLTINITSPEDGSDVDWRTWVEGETNLQNDTDYHIYVIINPADSGTWWVQPNVVFDKNEGKWISFVYIGREGMDWGSWQFVRAIITKSRLEDNTFDVMPENLVAQSNTIRVRRNDR